MKQSKVLQAGINIIVELKMLPDPATRTALVAELANLFLKYPDRAMLETWKERAGTTRIMRELREEIERQHAESTAEAMPAIVAQAEVNAVTRSVPPLDFVSKFNAKREAEERELAELAAGRLCTCGHPADMHTAQPGNTCANITDDGEGCSCVEFEAVP